MPPPAWVLLVVWEGCAGAGGSLRAPTTELYVLCPTTIEDNEVKWLEIWNPSIQSKSGRFDEHAKELVIAQ